MKRKVSRRRQNFAEKAHLVGVQIDKCCYYLHRNLIADIFGESGDEEEEEFTVSVTVDVSC